RIGRAYIHYFDNQSTVGDTCAGAAMASRKFPAAVRLEKRLRGKQWANKIAMTRAHQRIVLAKPDTNDTKRKRDDIRTIPSVCRTGLQNEHRNDDYRWP